MTMARKGLGQANTLRTNNNTETGYGIVYADEVSGHRTVGTLAALYALYDWQLSASGDNTDSDAIGQMWYVVDADGKGNGNLYQLIDWEKRNSADGWRVFTASAEVDLSGYATKSDLETAESTISEKITSKISESESATNQKVQDMLKNSESSFTEKLSEKADKTEVEQNYVKDTDLVSLTDADIDALWN